MHVVYARTRFIVTKPIVGAIDIHVELKSFC